ncbi:MAG: DUF2905 domain-containing protein [Elusimicrobiales bacterium]|nr:DUF2905 domain-containing protein [Elusimicrobiales bacterium]HOJ86039.1 DUF2905 domain-containing protein [Elusimicrobiales bacterium]HOL62246.1 DUF2905 domain-containing protein [Elusimicrobiales bacterium]HPO95424.1 DUF2905 domain-containing protein [Elusimicrobiales bacterium]
METPEKMAKIIMLFGFILVIIGLVLFLVSKNGWSFKLPGDIYYKKGGFSFYFPITTSILLSLIITIILHIFRK